MHRPLLLGVLGVVVAFAGEYSAAAEEAAEPEASTSHALRRACRQEDRLCDSGSTVACAELGSTYAAGTARCRRDCSGYDVSSCVRAAPGFTERVRPADRDARWANARCNDGSPASLQVRLSTTGSKNWVIGFNGGASCDDFRAENCAVRFPGLRTTDGNDRDFSPSMAILVPGPPQAVSGPFDADPGVNPKLHNANHVYLHYCSSDFYSGATAERIPNSGDPVNGWYFSGRLNVKASLEILKQRYGFDDREGDDREGAMRVLVLGQSAGGSGVVANVDQLVAAAPRAAARGDLRLIIEGAWHPDIDDPDARWSNGPPGTGTPVTVSDREAFRHSYEFWHAKSNGWCERNTAHPGDCYLGAEGYRSLTQGNRLPTIVFQNRSDPQLLADHSVNDPNAPVVARFGAKIAAETQGTVAWLYSPNDGTYIGDPLPWQILSPMHVITGQRYIHDYVPFEPIGTPCWTAGNGGRIFKDFLYAFWDSKKRSKSSVIFDNFDNVPDAARFPF